MIKRIAALLIFISQISFASYSSYGIQNIGENRFYSGMHYFAGVGVGWANKYWDYKSALMLVARGGANWYFADWLGARAMGQLGINSGSKAWVAVDVSGRVFLQYPIERSGAFGFLWQLGVGFPSFFHTSIGIFGDIANNHHVEISSGFPLGVMLSYDYQF